MPLKRFTLAAVHHRARRTGRGQLYIDDVLAAAEQQDDTHVWLSEESVQAIRDKWEPTHPSKPPKTKAEPKPLPRFVSKRLAICQECENCSDDGKKCRFLTSQGQAGVLMHPKGIPSPAAQCPTGQWGAVQQAGRTFVSGRRGEPIHGMIAVTSLSPRSERLERQAECLESWHNLGLSIVAVQPEDETKWLRQAFPFVDFVPAHRTHPKRPCVFIKDMAKVAADRQVPALLINSDIEILAARESFVEAWSPRKGELRAGVRWNYSTGVSDAEVEPSGIDVFLLTPEMAEALPDLQLAIGIPFWDYWVPYHFRSLGYDIHLDRSPCFFHRRHKLNWSREDWRDGSRVFLDYYQPDDFEPRAFRLSLGPS